MTLIGAVIFGVSAATGAIPPADATLVSVATGGAQGSAPSADLSFDVSENGRYVAFESLASNLAPGGTPGVSDIYVRDRTAGTTERITSAANGDEKSIYPAMSADGRYVAFASLAALVGGDPFGWSFYVHDQETGAVQKVGDSGGGSRPAISANGRFVAFRGTADRVVVYDRQAETSEIASVSSSGAEANNQSCCPSLSADGRFVSFASLASNLVPGDTNGVFDVFVRDRELSVTTRVSVASNGDQANGRSLQGVDGAGTSMSAEGRYVAFYSQASNLAAGDTNGFDDVFVHDREAGATTMVAGAGPVDPSATSSRPAISADGRLIVFDASGPGGSGPRHVYLHDRGTGETDQVSQAAGGGTPDSSSLPAAISGDGSTVVFASSASNLVAGDANDATDLFARALVDPEPSCDAPTISGTAANNTITGTAGPDVIDGGAGTDTIRGVGGDDLICGGDGKDTIYGGPGADTIVGEGGPDVLNGDADADELIGDYDETASVADLPAGDDQLRGLGGADLLVGDSRVTDGRASTAGTDKLFPGADPGLTVGDNYTAYGSEAAGPDTLTGDVAGDYLVGDNYSTSTIAEETAAGLDTINGNAGGDTLIGDNDTAGSASAFRPDKLNGGANTDGLLVGDNRAFGDAHGGANDTVSSGNGVTGAAERLIGDNYVYGDGSAFGGGSDILTANAGSDLLVGDNQVLGTGAASGGGDDRLTGGAGTNDMFGDNVAPTTTVGGGRDALTGGTGIDHLDGGPDLDTCAGAGGAADTAIRCETVTGVP